MSLNQRIFKSTIKVTAIGAVTQGLGFLLAMLIARYFGATRIADAYYLALAVPVMLIGAIGGVIKVVFVPILVEEKTKNPAQVPDIVGSATTLLLGLSCLGMVVVGLLLQLGILRLGQVTEVATLTRSLMILMLPLIPLTVLFNLLNAVYNSYQRFALAETAQALKSTLVIGFLIATSASWGIYSLAIGHVVGQAAALIMVISVVRRLGVSSRPRWSMPAGLKRMLRLSFLPFVSHLLLQLSPFIALYISSYLPEGSVSVLSYAERLARIPSLLIGTGFATVLVAYWSQLVADDDREALGKSFNRVVSALIMVLFPLAVGLIILREPLVNLAYEGGNFDASSALATASVFALLALQLIPVYLHMSIVRVLLAEKAVKALFWLNATSIVVGLTSIVVLGVWMGLGVRGVAVGMLVQQTLVMILAAVTVHRRYTGFSLAPLARVVLRVSLGVAVMAAVMIWASSLIPSDLAFFNLVVIGICSFAGVIVYFGILLILGHSDLISLRDLVLSQTSLFSSRGPSVRDV